MNVKRTNFLCLHKSFTLYGAVLLSVFSIQATDADSNVRIPNVTNTGANCINKDISQCTGLLEVLTKKDIGFAASQQQLLSMCPVLLEGLSCIDNYTKNCLSDDHRRYFNELYAGTIKVIKDLCDTKGTYQNEYLQHAACMREVNHKYDQCSDVYHAKTAKLNEINTASVKLTEDDRKRNVITLCCSFQEYLQCSERIVFETCGENTANFTKNFLHKMAGPIVQTKCSRYKPGSMVCLSSAAASSISSLGSLTLILFLLIVHRQATQGLFSVAG